MSALPRFFILTAVIGVAMSLADLPYPFPLIGTFVLCASLGGLLFSAAYVHAFMPVEWHRSTAGLRRLLSWGDAPMRHGHSHAND